MKSYLKSILFFFLSAFLLPLLVFFTVKAVKKSEPPKTEKDEKTISVYFHEENKVREMPLEEYIKGVVAAEMPASFEPEALKAQAVSARSYALYRAQNKNPDHPRAAVCTDFTHCKAYKSRQKAISDWGKSAKEYEKKIEDCVDATKGEVITYNGAIALAVFHSQSGGGKTESSKDVWGGNLPYLVSVESHGEENAPNFFSTAEFTFEEFKKIIENENSDAKINSFSDITDIKKTDGGNVASLSVGGETFSGSKIRTLFNLRSTCFTFHFNENKICFEVTGYGHGVGMSQYGANQMAKEGSSYKDILTHYYSGTKIEYV